jgi:hypothetical protein
MANAGLGNPVGAVPIFDAGVPKSMSGYARSVISGGCFVYCSGASAVVSSGTDSFVTSDILVTSPASGLLFNGIAAFSAASGAPITFYTEGVFSCVCGGAVVAGTLVTTEGSNAVIPVGSTSISVANGLGVIGRALTEGASGGYCLVHIVA